LAGISREERHLMIQLQNVRKTYGEIEALRGISTSIERGEIVGLLGPNGAGKTTAMKILVGYLLPTSGGARVAGHDVVEEPLAVQQKIGYLPENAPVYGDMLVQEYLQFMAQMRGLEADLARRNISRAVTECDIGGVVTREIGHLSKGYRQRVGLAAAILHDPQILILDEPTSGLDPNQIVEVRDLIRRMGQKKTVILSTHILPEVEATCDRAVILIDGAIRADGTLEELTRSSVQVVTVAPDDAEAAGSAFSALRGVEQVELAGTDGAFHTFRLTLAGAESVGEAVAEIVQRHGWPLRELRRDDKTLEQVFRELTVAHAEVAA
jgi:ABC-2 type transport system ATP-binding protein